MFLAVVQKFGAGLITSDLARYGLGNGVVFVSLLIATELNPFSREKTTLGLKNVTQSYFSCYRVRLCFNRNYRVIYVNRSYFFSLTTVYSF